VPVDAHGSHKWSLRITQLVKYTLEACVDEAMKVGFGANVLPARTVLNIAALPGETVGGAAAIAIDVSPFEMTETKAATCASGNSYVVTNS